MVTQFGKIVGIEGEGLTVLPPWRSLSKFSIRAEQADIGDAECKTGSAEGSTSDTQPVHVCMTVRYSIQPDKVAEVFEKYSHTGDLSSFVQTATQEVFKAVTARYTAPDLIAQRAKVSGDIYAALQQKLTLYGANVVNIDMRNFAFSDSYMQAINQKVTQEQLRLAAENKVKTVSAEQQAKVVTAEAERDAVKAQADGEAYAKLTNATAEAKSLGLQAQSLSQNPQVLELRRIEVEMARAQKWDGHLPVNMYASVPIPFLQSTDSERQKK